MAEQNERDPADYILPLSIGGLEGRMLHVPARDEPLQETPAQEEAVLLTEEAVQLNPAAEAPVKAEVDHSPPAPKLRREILYIYGHHSTLERWWGIVEVLNEYGAVTMPDLPGFGGMDSYYKVGQKPTLDALADYLAAFIKWRYKRKKVTVIAMSFGFAVVTRMLQRYPELTRKVEMFVSLAGFAHRDDFVIPRRQRSAYRLICKVGQNRLAASTIRLLVLNRPMLHLMYRLGRNAKFQGIESPEAFRRRIDVEVRLWRDNDLRTAMRTAAEFLVIDNCKVPIDLPIYHVGVANDNYLSNDLIEQHFRIIFKEFHLVALLDMANHSPSVVATAADAAPFVPAELRTLLSQ